jgi:hypothetical protein
MYVKCSRLCLYIGLPGYSFQLLEEVPLHHGNLVNDQVATFAPLAGYSFSLEMRQQNKNEKLTKKKDKISHNITICKNATRISLIKPKSGAAWELQTQHWPYIR